MEEQREQPESQPAGEVPHALVFPTAHRVIVAIAAILVGLALIWRCG